MAYVRSTNARKSSYLRARKISKDGMMPLHGIILERHDSFKSDPPHRGSASEIPDKNNLKVELEVRPLNRSPSKRREEEQQAGSDPGAGSRKKTQNLDKIEEGDDIE